MSAQPPRILIVDDEAPARMRLRTLLADIADSCPHQLAGEAGDARQALDLLAHTRADLVLLDVQMPGMNGMELAQLLGRQPHAPSLVFVSAHEQFALKAFDVQAVDYLLKPVRAERLAQAIRRVCALRAPIPSANRQFTIQEKGRVRMVPAASVLFLRAEQKYVTLRTADAEFLIESSLQSIEEDMPDLFIRVHRNALVLRSAIIGFERGQPTDGDGERDSWRVVLRGTDERLPVSRRQWPLVKTLIRER